MGMLLLPLRNEWEFEPARPGTPGRKAYATGSSKRAAVIDANPEALSAAIAEYERDKLAVSSWKTLNSRFLWWKRRCAARGSAPYPLHVARVRLAGAILMAARYRSAAQ